MGGTVADMAGMRLTGGMAGTRHMADTLTPRITVSLTAAAPLGIPVTRSATTASPTVTPAIATTVTPTAGDTADTVWATGTVGAGIAEDGMVAAVGARATGAAGVADTWAETVGPSYYYSNPYSVLHQHGRIPEHRECSRYA